MARCLIIAGGRRALALTGALRERGHAVRATTRDPSRREALRAAGAEPFLADPDRVATIAPAFDRVGVTCVLLGSATGSAEQIAALHSTRLDMLMEKMIDTTSRGVVYEAAGAVEPEVLAAGAERVRWWCERSLIPWALVSVDPADQPVWTAAAVTAVEEVLLSPGSGSGAPLSWG